MATPLSGPKCQVITVSAHIVRLRIEEARLDAYRAKSPLSQRAELRPGCPTLEDAVWSLLPEDSQILVAASAPNAEIIVNALCPGN